MKTTLKKLVDFKFIEVDEYGPHSEWRTYKINPDYIIYKEKQRIRQTRLDNSRDILLIPDQGAFPTEINLFKYKVGDEIELDIFGRLKSILTG